MHGSAPFMPVVQSSRAGLNLEIWSDPTVSCLSRVEMKLDVYGSLGKMVLRYRLAVLALPLGIFILVLKRQIKEYYRTGECDSLCPFTSADN